jgi:DNA polymerase I-like protein with 3'-5' exonuclease and polymerase domains
VSTLITTERQYRDMLRELRIVSNRTLELDGPDETGWCTVAIDTETTGLRLYLTDRPTGISVAYWWDDEEIHSWYLSINHPDSRNFSPDRLIRAINRHRGTHAYHHAEFDWKSLSLAGPFKLPAADRLWDTQVWEWLEDENTDHRLKQVSARRFGEDAKAEQQHINALKKGRNQTDIYRELRQLDEWKSRPAADARAEAKRLAPLTKKTWATFTAADLSDYGARDAELTLMCERQQRAESDWNDPEWGPAYQRELDYLYVIYDLMACGIRVNKRKCRAQAKVAEARLAELASHFEGINLNSVPQLIELVYGEWGINVKHRTKTGAPSTSREALEEHDNDPRVADLLEYRHLNKAVVSYYRPLYQAVDGTGRIHPSFSSTRTVTGRLSCSDPNLMTIPRADTLEGIRGLFVPAKGYELWEFDLSQAELRIMAGLCGDENLVGVLCAGEDLHNKTAELVFGKDFKPIQRRLAKNLNYGFPYNIGPRKFAKYMVVGTPTPVSECAYWKWSKWDGVRRPPRCRKCHVCQSADILDDMRRAYPLLVRLMSGLERVARKDGKLPMIVDGRYRHFRSPGRIVHYYTALNACVQGAVAEAMKSYMMAAWDTLKKMGVRVCLQVHDSLVCEVLPGTGPAVGAYLQSVADELDLFDEPKMIFDSSNWTDHA